MRNLLSGDNIRLTAVRESDLAIMEDWFNNAGFLRLYDMIPALPQSRKQLESLLNSFENTDERYLFAVRTHDKGKLIGIAGFDEIIWSSGVATVFIGIGDDSCTGKGLGKEAMGLLLDFGFNELNLYRIQLDVISYNTAAIKMYEGLGFIREGVYRDFIHRDQKRYDVYLYGLLRREWADR